MKSHFFLQDIDELNDIITDNEAVEECFQRRLEMLR